jgi:hypothetical protein
LAVVFVYGIWFATVYRRWNLAGVVAFSIAQVVVVTVAIVALHSAGAWPGIGRFFGGLTAVGMTGLFAGLAALLLAGGQATIRRVTV